jgi:hypothetical protein
MNWKILFKIYVYGPLFAACIFPEIVERGNELTRRTKLLKNGRRLEKP